MRKPLNLAHGARNGNAVLSRALIAGARALRKIDRRRWTWVALAKRCGVTESTIRRAVTGQTWARG